MDQEKGKLGEEGIRKEGIGKERKVGNKEAERKRGGPVNKKKGEPKEKKMQIKKQRLN